MGYLIKNNRIVFKNGRAVKTDEAPPEIFGMVDTFIKDGINPEMSRKILRKTRDLEPERRQALISAINILSDKFSKYKGQTVIVDKGNPYLRELQAEGARHGVKVIEGTVTEAEAKWWADAMQLETKITGKKTSVFVPEVQNAVNNLSAMHEAGLKVGKSGAMYGAGFSIGKNIVNMMRGNVSAGEAIGNVACDTAVSYGVGYAGGAVGSAVARTAAGRAIGSAVGSAAATIEGTAIGGAVTGAVGSATAAVGGLATSATAGAVGAIGAAGSAVGGALTAATAGTAIGGAVATGVAGATAAGVAVGAAAVAAAPVVAVGAVVGGLFSLFFDD